MPREVKEKQSKFIKHAESKAPFIDYRQVFKWETITELSRLRKLFRMDTENPVQTFSFDTETTGLNFETLKIVGYSFYINGDTGYYVPLRHRNGTNAPMDCLDFIVDRIISCKQVFMYNKKYDLNVLEISEGYEDIGVRFNVFDIMSLVWVRDTDIKMPSLKDASEWLLGIQQPRISEVMGTLTFDYADIAESTEYAGLDAICTSMLAKDTIKKHKNLMGIFKIDNLAIEALRKFELEKVRLDIDFLKREESITLNRIGDYKRKIFEMVGSEFNMNSDRQIAQALMKSGVVLTEKTKPSKRFPEGQWKVSMDILEKIDHPVTDLMVKYSSAFTYYNNFIRKLIDEAGTGGRLRFNYKCMATVTGRLSSGESDKIKDEKSYFARLNAQNIPKPKQILVGVVRSEKSVTGWDIVDLEEVGSLDENKDFQPNYSKHAEFYVCESGSYDHGVRAAFIPEDNHVFVSIDYAAEELRIAANFSNEPIWVDAFLHDRDLHMETAKAVWGDHADKNHRKKAKSVNFALLYGGSDYTLHQNQGISKTEAKALYDTYQKALPTLSRWKNYMQRTAKSDGSVYSAFGRPYRLAKFFKQGTSYGQKAYGERCALNYPVQGSGGDIIRMVLGKLLRFREKYPKVKKAFRFITTVHDEINFSVHKKWIHQFMRTVPKMMYMNFPEWQVPLEVDVGIGNNWGRCISYTYNEETKIFTPSGDYHANIVKDND